MDFDDENFFEEEFYDQDIDLYENEDNITSDPPQNYVRLRPSQFKGFPSTIFFEYPLELGINRADCSQIEHLGLRKLGYGSYWKRICVKKAFQRAGFINNDKSWTVLWTKHQNEIFMKDLNCLQKINHFPDSWCIGRKDRLVRTLSCMKRIHGEEFNFHPESFVLPADKDNFLRLKCPTDQLWVCKPVNSSCGRGIRVLTAIQAQQLAHKTSSRLLLLQKYLTNPLLISGHKFDLRLYVLVTGVDPLRLYLHSEGLTRIAAAPYSVADLTNSFAHLTNYSVNKGAAGFSSFRPDCEASPVSGGQLAALLEARRGCKWSLTALRGWLTETRSAEHTIRLFQKIDALVVKTVIAAEEQLTPKLHSAVHYRSNCYELFGFDVILDEQLEPHLLEVNVSPSLAGDEPLDDAVKGLLLADMLHTVGCYPHDPALLEQFSGHSMPQRLRRAVGGDEDNPFLFPSLPRCLLLQDAWRRRPDPANICLEALTHNREVWLLLLSIEDEFSRAQSSSFRRLHPLPDSAIAYSKMYRCSRFFDHVLARWVAAGGAAAPAMLSLVPCDLLYTQPPPAPPKTAGTAQKSRPRLAPASTRAARLFQENTRRKYGHRLCEDGLSSSSASLLTEEEENWVLQPRPLTATCVALPPSPLLLQFGHMQTAKRLKKRGGGRIV